jgi:hypothetical protein
MRLLVALVTAVTVFATGVVPWHRCAPAGTAGAGVAVLAGSHAHEGHDARPLCDGDCDCEERSDGGRPHSEDERCCVDVPQDPTGLPSVGALDLDLPVSGDGGRLFVARTPALEQVASAWQAPVPRIPTGTVVLLR